MSTEYLTAPGRHQLGRALHTLETLAPYLDHALTTRPPASEAAPSHQPTGPRPPLSIPTLDIKYEAEQSVCGWACNLAADLGCAPPEVLSIAHAAAWLHERVHDIAVMPWAADCLDELHTQARRVDSTVNPTPVEATTLPLPAHGSARQVAEALALLGIPISHTSLRRLAKRGELTTTRRDDGVDEFNLAECKAYATKWHQNTAKEQTI